MARRKFLDFSDPVSKHPKMRQMGYLALAIDEAKKQT
jgi:hypothetical protein